MASSEETLARMISRRAKNDPKGFKEAVSSGSLKSYLKNEAVNQLKVSEAQLDQFLREHCRDLGIQKDEAQISSNSNIGSGSGGDSSSTGSSSSNTPSSSSSSSSAADEARARAQAKADEVRRIVRNFDLEAISMSIDTMAFQSMYETETRGQLDAQLNSRLVELNTQGGDGLKLLGKRLELPKVACFTLSILSGAYAVSAFLRGSLITATVQALVAHDLFRVSYNCYLNAYVLHGTRRIGSSTVNFGSAVLSSITSAITGTADPATSYLREVDLELLQINTLTPVLWIKAKNWYHQQLQRPNP